MLIFHSEIFEVSGTGLQAFRRLIICELRKAQAKGRHMVKTESYLRRSAAANKLRAPTRHAAHQNNRIERQSLGADVMKGRIPH